MRSLTLKYRPSDFSTVCGQQVITATLAKAIETKTFKNAMLFCGPSGCGKTTLARIFANKVNNGVGEPIEIDAASNAGVDAVRAIVADAKQRSLTGEYKVVVIDECHAITSAGWQAFLKGIEEPSEYTIYIFCTTEPQKIPATILNRVQKYNLARISVQEIRDRLELICANEGFTNYQLACDYISKLANGGMRDAISYLDQCATYSTDLSMENVKVVLGDATAEILLKLSKYLIDKNEMKVLSTIDAIYQSGQDLRNFVDQFINFSIDMTKFILFSDLAITNIPAYLNEPGNEVVNYVIGFPNNLTWFKQLSNTLLEAKFNMKYDNNYKSTLEIYLLNICRV